MWKKLALIVLTFIGVLFASYSFYIGQIKATPAPLTYYGIGDTFERNHAKTINMGGILWTLVYADQSSGEGIIASQSENLSFRCGKEWIKNVDLDTCLSKIDQQYQSAISTSDDMGKIIYEVNSITHGISRGRLLALDQYLKITDNEQNFTMVPYLEAWGNDRYS